MDGTLRKVRLRAAVPVVPLAAFILVTFIAPLATMLVRSVYDPLVAEAMPETLLLLSEWDGKSIPREAVFEAAVGELLEARQARNLGRIVTRINRVQPGMRSVIMKSVRRLRRISGSDSWRDTLIDMDPAWGKAQTWRAIRRTGERFTMRHYLHAVDLDRGPGGGIVRQEPERRIYIPLLGRTLAVSLSITALCLLLGYPVAYLIANAPARWANLLLLLVLVPFWTSLLVRTTSWIVLLQTRGVINDALVALGLIAEENRIAMIYNMTGTVVAMTHVLLPFMVLPLYSVMRTIPPLYMNAAATLGASFPRAFRRVYLPQTQPGVFAGSLLVFILAIGYYITPELVGGRSGQLISNMIAYHMQQSLNWGLAAAISGILLLCVFAIYLIYDRAVGIERMRLG